MGKKWVTPEQESWLKERLPTFIATQKAKTSVTVFYPELHKEWRQRWPDPSPTQEELRAAGGNSEKALKAVQIRMDEVSLPRNNIALTKHAYLTKCQVSWFHNHCRNIGPASNTCGILKIIPKTRVLQDWQIYQALTYKTQWKNVIDREWLAHQKNWKAANPGAEFEDNCFSYMNNFLKEKFSNETPEMKQKVAEAKAQMLSSDGQESLEMQEFKRLE